MTNMNSPDLRMPMRDETPLSPEEVEHGVLHRIIAGPCADRVLARAFIVSLVRENQVQLGSRIVEVHNFREAAC